ncbi:MAG: hypothetical protein ABI600_20760 [Luteolibacter sp.]
MESTHENLPPLARKIAEAETKLENLELEIAEIGLPAATELRRRLEILKIEDKALKRNFEDSIRRGEPDSVRLEKIESLLGHIEREESSVKQEADFLHQSVPSSMTMVAEAGAHAVDLLKRGVKHVIGGHRPLGSSVFVNHSHDNLVDYHGLKDEEAKAPGKNISGE